jgi:rRNA maturation endonuclease Nob1
MWSWECHRCDVEGRDFGPTPPVCWNCGGPVTITARPTVLVA